MDNARLGVVSDALGGDLRRALKAAQALGVSSVQLSFTVGALAGVPVDDIGSTAARDIRHTASNLGLSLSGAHADYDVRLHQTEGLDPLVQRIRRDLQVAGRLMLPLLTTSLGALPEQGEPRDAALGALEGLGEAAQVAGVILALSAGPGTASQLAETLDALGRGAIAANLDPGRLALRGEGATEAVEKLAGDIAHVHASDGIAGEGLLVPGQGDLDWRELIGALEAADYTGPLTLRVEPGPRARRQVDLGLAFLRSL